MIFERMIRFWLGDSSLLILMRVMSLYRCKFQLFWSDFLSDGDWKLGQRLVLEDSMNKLVVKLMVLDFLLKS